MISRIPTTVVLSLAPAIASGPAACGGPAEGKAYPAPFDVGAPYDREIRVSPRGDDGGDGSRERPFRTLARAARGARPGTSIALEPGTYPGGTYLADLRGKRGRPIRIIGRGDGGAVIEGRAEGIHLTDPRHVVLENLTIRGCRSNGINVDDGGSYETPAAHVIFRRLRITGVGSGGNQDGLKLSGLDRFWVLGCSIGGNSPGGSAIDMVGCHDGVLGGNRIYRQGASGIQCKGGSRDVLVFANTFEDIRQRAVNIGGSTGRPYFRPRGAPYEARRVHVFANLFLRCHAPVAFVGCQECDVAHNTIIRPGKWTARILQETRFVEPCANGTFANNLVVFGRGIGRPFVNIGPSTRPETFRFSHNLWYNADDPARSRPLLPASIADRGPVYGRDPRFVDAGKGDYRIRADSPARGAGMRWTVRCDRRGTPFADPPSIGAWEAAGE